MGKRSPGHIEQLPSGSWRVKVYGGTDPLTGREIRLRKTCKTERAAQIELGKLLEQAAAGRQPETNATVAVLMDKYAEVADWDLPGHIHAIWELSTLAAELHHIYGGERPDLARALELYDRWLPGTMRRIAAITRSCVPECAMRRRQW